MRLPGVSLRLSVPLRLPEVSLRLSVLVGPPEVPGVPERLMVRS